MICCAHCQRPIDPTSPSSLQRVQGWEKRAISASRRGGSDILMREHVEEFIHSSCAERMKAGLSAQQETLAL